MPKKIGLLWLLTLFISINLESCPYWPRTIIKSNLLNTFMIPSIHLEQEINPNTSIQLNLHRGSLVFISPDEWINASINMRKYLKPHLNKWYGAAGVNYHYNILATRYNQKTGNFLKGSMSLGPELRIGYQSADPYKFRRWVFDVNIGASLPFVPLQPHGIGKSVQARLTVGIGYQLSHRNTRPITF